MATRSGGGAPGTMNGPSNSSMSQNPGSRAPGSTGAANGAGMGPGSGGWGSGTGLGMQVSKTSPATNRGPAGGISAYNLNNYGLKTSSSKAPTKAKTPTKVATPYKKPATAGYKKVQPKIAAAAAKRKPGLPSIPPNALMYAFEGRNFSNAPKWGTVVGNTAPKRYNDRVPTNNGELRWSSTGIGGYPSRNTNKDQSRVGMAKGGSVPGKRCK